MVKLIYSSSTANNGEQHKDNDINITKYLEFNKDKILNLTEKHYENLVEVLTCNVIDTAADYSDPKLSLPSSPMFNSDPYNQNDIYKKKSQKFMMMIKALDLSTLGVLLRDTY
jgi:hypothetical protein